MANRIRVRFGGTLGGLNPSVQPWGGSGTPGALRGTGEERIAALVNGNCCCLFPLAVSFSPSCGTRDLALQGREIHLQRRLEAGISMALPTDKAAPSVIPDRQTAVPPCCGASHQMLPALDETSWLGPRRADETQSLGTAGAQSCQAL